MKQYSDAACCPKCESRGIGVRFDRQAYTGREVMRRNCGRCGYEWDEAPRDARSEPGDDK